MEELKPTHPLQALSPEDRVIAFTRFALVRLLEQRGWLTRENYIMDRGLTGHEVKTVDGDSFDVMCPGLDEREQEMAVRWAKDGFPE